MVMVGDCILMIQTVCVKVGNKQISLIRLFSPLLSLFISCVNSSLVYGWMCDVVVVPLVDVSYDFLDLRHLFVTE